MTTPAVPPSLASPAPLPCDTKTRVRTIKRSILEEEQRIRGALPWLRHQNFLGLAWFLSSVVAIAFTMVGYFSGDLAWYWAILLIGLPVSILHELEHDLIHNLYFRKKKWMQNIMFATIWLFKFHANPWWRKDLHHWHHRVSGQPNDVEERLLGLGMPLGLERLGVALHPGGFASQLPSIEKDSIAPPSSTTTRSSGGFSLDVPRLLWMNGWTAIPLSLVTKAFPVLWAATLLLTEDAQHATGVVWMWPAVRDFMVLVVFPQLVRQGALHAMTTASHYYGDIPAGDVFYQNQILDHWSLIPFQLYCCNFGSTHIIHHYIPNQPFYLRSMIASKVHRVMITQGVRRNDWGILSRANRWHTHKQLSSDNPIDQEYPSKASWGTMLWFTSFYACMAFVFAYDPFTAVPMMRAISKAVKQR